MPIGSALGLVEERQGARFVRRCPFGRCHAALRAVDTSTRCCCRVDASRAAVLHESCRSRDAGSAAKYFHSRNFIDHRRQRAVGSLFSRQFTGRQDCSHAKLEAGQRRDSAHSRTNSTYFACDFLAGCGGACRSPAGRALRSKRLQAKLADRFGERAIVYRCSRGRRSLRPE
jgi:hypothetical protein